MSRVSISVIIPVFNERRTIRTVIDRVMQVDREKEIIVVDDHSTDGTRRLLRDIAATQEIRVVFQSTNRGKGAALRAGFELATKDVVIIQDADLEYHPDDYPVLLEPIESRLADVVFGSRFQHGKRRVMYFWHSVGNKILTTLSNIFSNLNLTDMETCYKVFRRQIIQNVVLESDRFGFEPEVTAKLSKLPVVIYEVPINYYGRSYREGKKITWRDGMAALYYVVKYSLSSKPFIRDWASLSSVLVTPPEPIETGIATLEAFESARRYNRWIFDRIQGYVHGDVLEVGSGIGNITEQILSHPKVESIVVTDIDPVSLETLDVRHGDDSRLSLHCWDVENPPPPGVGSRQFHTIISTNVLEHVLEDRTAVEQMVALLRPGGRLIVLVPAGPRLFSELDRNLGHHRRYSAHSLRTLLGSPVLHLDRLFAHNMVGALGWWWSGKVRRRPMLRPADTRRFDRLVPLLRHVDAVLCLLVGGVSWIAVGSKSMATDERHAGTVRVVKAKSND